MLFLFIMKGDGTLEVSVHSVLGLKLVFWLNTLVVFGSLNLIELMLEARLACCFLYNVR